MKEALEKYTKALEYLKDTMITAIEENWEDLTEAGYGAEKGMPDAETFLGHSVKGMSREEIDEEVSEIQLAYFTEQMASLEEIVSKYNQIFEI